MKIFIMGPSGSGTSTLGRRLSAELGMLQQDSDNFFWEDTNPPFTIQRDIHILHGLFNSFLENEHFILSGDVLNWGLSEEKLINCFTHVIFLYIPWEVRAQRIRQREKERFGERILVGGDMHKTYENFMIWASKYESGQEEGRNFLSQKRFLRHFQDNRISALEINESLDLEKIVQLSLSFLK